MASEAPPSGARDRPSWPQRLLDDVFLLVAVGLVVPTIFYIVFGLLSLFSVPAFEP